MELVLYIQSDRLAPSTMQKVDLYKDEVVSLTMTLQDIRDIEKVRTDFSQPFTLPASDVNNKIFQHWYNPEIIGYDGNYRTPAIIELNYLPFRKGFVTLNSCKMKNGEPEFWNITFLGETVDLKNIISEDQLSQLTFLDSPGIVYANNNNSARQGMNSGLDKTDQDGTLWEKAFVYPLLSHSVAFQYDSGNSGNSAPYTNLYSSANKDKSGCFFNDFKPAIRVDLLLRAIERTYNLTFSTDFFFTSATENLYLWMSRNKGPMVGGGRVSLDNVPTTCTPFAPNSCTFFQGNLEAGDSNCFYLFPQYINQEVIMNNFSPQVRFGTLFGTSASFQRYFMMRVQIDPLTGYETTPYNITIRDTFNDVVELQRVNYTGVFPDNAFPEIPGQVVLKYNQAGFPTGAIGAPPAVGDNYSGNFVLTVDSDEAFLFDVNIQITYVGPNTEAVLTPDPGGGFDCEPITILSNFSAKYEPAGGSVTLEVDVIPTQQLPQIKILDFLTGLFKTFNLTAYFQNGITVVQTLDEFYANFNTWDLTPNVHADSNTVSEALPFSEINFIFEDPKTILAQQFEQFNNRKYGELRFVAEASKQGTYEVKSPFEHMLFERMSDSNNASGPLTLQQGTFLDDNLNPSFGKPLLFYAVENSDSSNTLINWINGQRPVDVKAEPVAGSRQPFRNYMMPSNSNELGSVQVAPTINLNYGSEINTYNLTDYSGNNNSLYLNYYNNYITRVFDPRNRIFSFKVKLPIDFLLNFKLSDKIIIGNRSYLINKINANLTTGESTLELLNIF